MDIDTNCLAEKFSADRLWPQAILDDLFETLGPMEPAAMFGEWRVGYLFTEVGTGSLWEPFIRRSPIRLYSKRFYSAARVQAWVLRVGRHTFAVPGTGATLHRVEFRGVTSAAMVYDHMPLIDHFRRVDDNLVMGIMEARTTAAVYFYLRRLSLLRQGLEGRALLRRDLGGPVLRSAQREGGWPKSLDDMPSESPGWKEKKNPIGGREASQ